MRSRGSSLVHLLAALGSACALLASAPARVAALAEASPGAPERVIGADVRWVRVEANLLVDTPDSILATVAEAHAAGADGVFLSDAKTSFWFAMPESDRTRWLQRVTAVRDGIHALGMTMVVDTASLGYCSGLLSLGPDLAAGTPVRDVPLRVSGRRLVPISTAQVRNGSFERHHGDRATGWSFQDVPGEVSFIDHRVRHSGAAALRLEPNPAGDSRIFGSFQVRPFQQYRLTFWTRARGLTTDWIAPYVVSGDGRRRLTDQQMSRGGRDGTFFSTAQDLTFGWRRMSIAFNSMNARRAQLALGAWGQSAGRLWFDDVSIESVPTLNVIRRGDLPVSLRTASGRRLREGVEVSRIEDPRLGNVAWPGDYDTYHRPPAIRLRPGAGLHQGDLVRLSAQTATVTAAGQVSCSWNHPRVLALIRRANREAAERIRPDGIFLSMDEVRGGGWDPEDLAYGSSAAALAGSLNHVLDDLSEVAPGLPVYVWSDMFDPTQNAVPHYYQTRGSLKGSWKGIDPGSVVIVNWKSGEELPGPAARSLRHFASLGFTQIIAGYYDEPVDENHANWVAAAGATPGLTGSMYTTWERDYTHLAEFGSLWW